MKVIFMRIALALLVVAALQLGLWQRGNIMGKNIWFDDHIIISKDFLSISKGSEDIGAFFSQTVEKMPGISSALVLTEEPQLVVIRTNEGTMTRSNVQVTRTKDRLLIEFDEAYEAGRIADVSAHHLHQFEVTPDGINSRVTISNVIAPGFLGILYKRFGSRNIGDAILKSYKDFVEGT